MSFFYRILDNINSFAQCNIVDLWNRIIVLVHNNMVASIFFGLSRFLIGRDNSNDRGSKAICSWHNRDPWTWIVPTFGLLFGNIVSLNINMFPTGRFSFLRICLNWSDRETKGFVFFFPVNYITYEHSWLSVVIKVKTFL